MEFFSIGKDESIVSDQVSKPAHLLFFPVFISPSGQMAAQPLFSPIISTAQDKWVISAVVLSDVHELHGHSREHFSFNRRHSAHE